MDSSLAFIARRRKGLVGSASIVAVLGLGCGPVVQLDDGAESSGDETSGTGLPPGTTVPGTTAPPPDTTAMPPPPPPDTTGADTGVVFLLEPDVGGGMWWCDFFEQDCPPGEKCMPWADGGGNTWNALRCSPVATDPDAVGEPCQVEDSPLSGVDTCDYGSMCWNVDPRTLEGTCVAFCVGDEANPYCEDETSSCSICGDNCLPLCIPDCDPLAQDCPPGQACYPVNDEFICAPDASGDMGVPGDPCEFINVCDPGSFCASASLVPDCPGGVGCCSPFCALDDLMPPCLPGQGCVPWYEPGTTPPGYENVGACVLPM